VANAEEGKPQTVSKDNEERDWHTGAGFGEGQDGEIIGIPQEMIDL